MGLQSNQPSSSGRNGTPKTRNTNGQAQSSQGMSSGIPSSNRVKSSRQSNRMKPVDSATHSGPAGGSQQRAITPKQAQKLYSSINLNKNNGRGVSTGKINGNVDFGGTGNYT